MKKSILLSLTLLFAAAELAAQDVDVRQLLSENPSLASGIYASYHYDNSDDSTAPEGYAPFYISHFGRHGSRWHSSARPYDKLIAVFAEAEQHNALTELGRDVYGRLQILKADADGREGQLTPKGTAEHRGIAERMYAACPEVFDTSDGRRCRIEARSTLVPRCIMSMAAFCERLKELNPDIEISRAVGERYLPDMARFDALNRNADAARALAAEYQRSHSDPERLVKSLFKDSYARKHLDTAEVARSLHHMASGTADVDYLGITLFDIFTDEELYTLWSCSNAGRYLTMGPSVDLGDGLLDDARHLLRHMIDDAEEAIVSGGRAAFLRFVHDVNVTPLTALLEIEGKSARVAFDDLESELPGSWQDFNVSPMATNLQFIFYRSGADDDILVKVLHNESPCRLPLPRDLYPYYRWQDFKAYYLGER